MKKIKDKLKSIGWKFYNDRRGFNQSILKPLHLLTLKRSEYYSECINYYSHLNVKNKYVLDIGSDFGTTPMYFLQRGALTILGISEMKQYFYNDNYRQLDIMPIHKVFDLQKLMHFQVLKSNSNGFEWNFTKEFINSFQDWIIVCHYPIQNPELFKFIEFEGKLIGKEEYGAVYKKRGV